MLCTSGFMDDVTFRTVLMELHTGAESDVYGCLVPSCKICKISELLLSNMFQSL